MSKGLHLSAAVYGRVINKGIKNHYINTNEIPCELSCYIMIFSHMTLTCYLHTRKDHHCHGYIHVINCVEKHFTTERRNWNTPRELLYLCAAM